MCPCPAAHQHSGPTDGDHDVDWAQAVGALQEADRVWRTVQRAQVQWLAPTAGDVVIEVGCGAGGMTAVLAAAVGPSGTVIATDAEPRLLEATAAQVRDQSDAAPVRTRSLDLSDDMPQDLIGHAHLVVARSVIHHLPDEVAAVSTLSTLLRPGGRLAIGEGGLPFRGLPDNLGLGRPGLQARLEVVGNRWFQGHRQHLSHPVDRAGGWPQVLQTAGLVGVRSRSFLLDHPSPVDAEVRAAVATWLDWLREADRAQYLEPDDREVLDVLLDPDDARSVHRRDDLAVLAVATVHTGSTAVEVC